jgi:hypothetical protein
MKLSEFIVLDEQHKKQVVLHQGVLIGKRSNYDHIVFLFQLNNYYVETYCHKEEKKIVEYQAFEHIDLLAPYLENIPINELLN